LAALLFTVFAATGILLARGPSCGHDFDFHLVSWMEVARGWHSGLIYPHWASSANYGAGEPRFVFYPPASWMLGAGFGSIVGWQVAPWLFTALCLLAAGLSMQRLAREWLPRMPSIAAACLYVANPYMLFVAYERTAYGELMAAALMPLLLSFAVRPVPPIAALAATIAGIWLMNAPTGVIACYALLWISVLRLVWQRTWRAPLRIAAATTVALALDAFYLVPAAYQQRWVDIARAVGPGMRFQDSFLFRPIGEPFHDAVLHTASVIACILLAFALASYLLWRDAHRHPPLSWLVSFAPLILLLLLPISTPLWRYAPRLGYVQFPWRWLIVLAPVATLWLIGAIAQRARPAWLIAGGVVLCGVSLLFASRHFYQPCDEEDAVAPQIALMQAGTGEEGTDEYTPRDDDNAEIDQGLPPVRVLLTPGAEEPNSGNEANPDWHPDPNAEGRAVISIGQWSPERHSVDLDSPAAGFAVFRLMDYPAWTVRRNGVEVARRPRREDGLLTVPVPQGHSRIEIRWRTTADVSIGRALSLLALCAFGLLLYRQRRDHTPANS
jgi:hypothetical protein